MHFRESNFQKFSAAACPRTPLEAQAFGPSVYRAARLLYHENPPTSKLNETPVMDWLSVKETVADELDKQLRIEGNHDSS